MGKELTVNLNEVKALLDQISATDGRRVPEAMPAAWLRILGRFSYLDCQAAIEKHFEESTEWLMPAHIVKAVKAKRTQRLQAIGPVNINRHERLDAAEEVQTIREIKQHLADGTITAEDYRFYQNSPVTWEEFKTDHAQLATSSTQALTTRPGAA